MIPGAKSFEYWREVYGTEFAERVLEGSVWCGGSFDSRESYAGFRGGWLFGACAGLVDLSGSAVCGG